MRTNDVLCSIDDGGGGDGDVDPAAVAAMSAVEDVVRAVNSRASTWKSEGFRLFRQQAR